jgi:hypothetical protein
VTGLDISARLRLPGDEGVAEIDVFTALKELLDRSGESRAQLEVWREGGNGAVLTNGRM